jgi:hypothetical protein
MWFSKKTKFLLKTHEDSSLTSFVLLLKFISLTLCSSQLQLMQQFVEEGCFESEVRMLE